MIRDVVRPSALLSAAPAVPEDHATHEPTDHAFDGDRRPPTLAPRDVAAESSPHVEQSATAAASNIFSTDHLIGNLNRRAVRGGAVTVLGQGVKLALQTTATVVLARLLTPADFGLVAIAMILPGFLGVFKDAGLSLATVQRDRITHAQISTLFWLNALLGLLLAGLACILAPAFAVLYRDERLVGIIIVASVAFVLTGLMVQHQALLRRQMRFRATTLIEIGALAAGVGTAIAMALVGFGYWSLVGMTLVSTLVTAIFLWLALPWRPGLPRRHAGVRPMLGFGGNATLAGVVHYFALHAESLLLGWWWGPAPVGLYNKVHGLMGMPLRQLNAPLATVAFSALSRAVADPQRYRRAYLRVVEQMLFVTGPPMIALIMCAHEIIALLLGAQWLQAAPAFAILGFAALIVPLANSTGWLFVSQDRMREHLHYQVLSAASKLVAVAIGLR